MILAIVCNEANNDLQPCGTSASERCFGRSSSPFLSLLQQPVMPAPSMLLQLQKQARNAWREAANDRAFQQLLVRQLGPQASVKAPQHGDLVYYRRPNPMNDGPVYRGPAEVIGTSERTDQAYLTHGGLFVRAAFEDLKPVRSAQQAAAAREGPTTPDGGGPEATLEELDEGDGPAPHPPDEPEPPVVVVAPRGPGGSDGGAVVPPVVPPTLEPASPVDGYALDPPITVEGSSVPDQVDDADDTHVSPQVTAEGTPVPGDVASPISPNPIVHTLTDQFADPLHVDAPDWYADDSGDLGAELFPGDDDADLFDIFTIGDPGEDDDAVVEAPAMGLDAPAEVLVPPPPDPVLEEDPREVAVGVPDNPHYGLQVGDRVTFTVPTEGGGTRWASGEVFGLPLDRPDRVSLRMDDADAMAMDEPNYMTVNLGQENWRQIRAKRAVRASRIGPAPAVLYDKPPEPALLAGNGVVEASGGVPEVSGGSAATLVVEPPNASDASGGDLGRVLAAIAALERRIASGGGGDVQPKPKDHRGPTILTALISHSPNAHRNANAVPSLIDGPDPPRQLSSFVRAELEHHLVRWNSAEKLTNPVEDLQRAGILIADMFAGTLYLALAAYCEREPQVTSSDTTALEGIRALGSLVGDKEWRPSLCSSAKALLEADETNAITPWHVGEFLVMVEQGIATESGANRASISALNANVDTQVYQYTEDDLTPEMILEGAKNEMAQFDKYKVWGSDFKEKAPADAVVMDAKYFSKPKVRQVDGKPVLFAKGRLTPKGFQDPEKFTYRVDSPTVARWVLYVVLMVGMSLGWEFIKGDISGAFLQGEHIERTNVWLRLPQILVDLGLIPATKRFRRVVKAVYGMNEAPRKWWRALTETAKAMGFVVSLLDPCLLLLQQNGRVVCVILIYVDDLIIGAVKEKALEVTAALEARYPMGQVEKSWEQPIFSYTGKDVVFKRDSDGKLIGIQINQTAYVKNKVAEVVDAPKEVGQKSPQELLSPTGADWYRTANGRLAWTGNTRPTNAFDISECASATKVPTAADAKRLSKVLRGVLDTADDGIYLPRVDPENIGTLVFADASFANRGERTQGGYCVFLTSMSTGTDPSASTVSGGMVVHKSGKIARVCVATFDAETIETVEGSDAGLCVSYLVTELLHGRLPSMAESVLLHGYGHAREVPRPRVWTKVLNDGYGTVSAVHSTRPVTNRRRKIDIALLRESVDEGVIELEHCETGLMVADALTKRMNTEALRRAATRGEIPLKY